MDDIIQLKPSEDDFRAAFLYMLERLHELGLIEIADEIGTAVRTQVIERAVTSDLFGMEKSDRADVGQTSLRPRSAAEEFELGLDILSARLVEPSEIVSALSEALGRDPSRIRFSPDENSEVEIRNPSAFGADELLLPADQLARAKSALTTLRKAIRHADSG